MALDLEELEKLDRFLWDEWGICTPLDEATWWKRLPDVAGEDLAAQWKEMADGMWKCKRKGAAIPLHLNERMYELMSVRPLLGLVHSQKREYILDTAALLTWLVKTLEIRGDGLDLGCHVGYHAIWLAQECGLTMTGIDRSVPAITRANHTAQQWQVNARFEATDWNRWHCDRRFSLITALDTDVDMRSASKPLLRVLSQNLADGGVFVWCGGAEDYEAIQHTSKCCGLAFGFGDLAGGWTEYYQKYGNKQVYVFVKHADSVYPEDVKAHFTRAWESEGQSFPAYCDRIDMDPQAKTHAWYRTALKVASAP